MNEKFAEYQRLNLPKIAEEMLSYWQKNKIFEKSITTREGKEQFVFYEGPPSANGLPGIHHVMGRTIKDIFCRYKAQKGYQVKRKAGWDTHGLPIELGVEKELGINKEDIGTKISIEQYNTACKEAVMRYTDIWNKLTQKMGYWVDMQNPYITYKPKYMESVWWLLKQIHNKGLLYKGYTVQPYSPKAGTGLSSHELNQPGAYQDITDTTVVAQFKAINKTLPVFLQRIGAVYFLAWTTTPWTLPSNTALTVGLQIQYVLIKTYNRYTFKPIQVVLAKNLIAKQFADKIYKEVKNQDHLANYSKHDKQIPYFIIKEFAGKELIGVKYEQLLPYALPYQNAEHAFRIISGDFVTTQEGTGIVHTAPTFGADDALVAKQAKPEVPPMLVLDKNNNPVPLVDLQGKFRPELAELAGKYVKNQYYAQGEEPKKSVDIEIAIKLKTENKAFKVEKYQHSYPNCWRTDKPILYYPLNSWFIKVSKVRDQMFSLNKSINWKPKSTGEKRFGNWLKNANDWNLSRSRFWGIPLPIWTSKDGTEQICIGSVAELKEEMQKSVTAGIMPRDIFADFETGNMTEDNYNKIDLHKNVVDKIVLVSSSGKALFRESDLIDVWFDSGSMPYAQWHYPFENKEIIDNKQSYPANFIAEGVDQTRGWFYTLHAIATMVFNSVAFKNVVSNGLVLDKNGQKMSKRIGNAVDPFETLAKHGPDATRWYMVYNANPWDNLKFDSANIEEIKRKFFGTLYNTYSFFSLYANIDNFSYKEKEVLLDQRPEIDRWILSELNTLIQKTDAYYADYEPTKATRAVSDFVQDMLSNWYVRLCRRRFWKADYVQDKISAYQTLYTCLVTIAKLGAPVAPFFMDKLYKDLTSTTGTENFESVHLSDFPVFDKSSVDKYLERKMESAQTISSLVLSLRAKEKIKVRIPLKKIIVPVLDNVQRKEILAVAGLIKSEVNVKEIELLDDASDVIVKQIKPNFKSIGPRLGKDIGLVSNILKSFSQKGIALFEKNKKFDVKVKEKLITLDISDVEISLKDIEGWQVASAKGITVALDVSLNDDLRKEGIARELINRIQNARKDFGLEVTDRIKLTFLSYANLKESVFANETYIKTETLASELKFVEKLEGGIEIEFDTIKSKMLIEKK
ncbi:MAG: isoleucine--tRNA ligase [Tenacibaculum sp.]